MNLLAELEQRGLIHNSTDRDALEAAVSSGPISLYYGCDPTADSLHVGNLIGLVVLRRFQALGHQPIALAGGGTGMVGDPSGKSADRPILAPEVLAQNLAAISAQIQQIVPEATIVDNAKWLGSLRLVDFLRDVGKHATVSSMVAKESVRSRIGSESGISFTEFAYMLLQAYDFYELNQTYQCQLQIGGSDQWGNITAGLDLVRKKTGASLHGLTWPLLVRADGRKFGKTEDGTVWLSPEKTSPYHFFQYWLNSDDRDVCRLLRCFTFLSLEEIAELERTVELEPEKRTAQRVLAHEVTQLVHGPEAALDAESVSRVLFSGDTANASSRTFEALATEIPTLRIAHHELVDGTDISSLLLKSGLTKSISDGRRTIAQGGIYANGRKLGDTSTVSPGELVHGKYVLLRRGKQNYALVIAE
jgi:tyrosyl-tRNA synthetase